MHILRLSTILCYANTLHHCMSQYAMCAVQIGTACVTRGQDSRLALGRLGALVEQLETLVRGGREVILVTSGTHLAFKGWGERGGL